MYLVETGRSEAAVKAVQNMVKPTIDLMYDLHALERSHAQYLNRLSWVYKNFENDVKHGNVDIHKLRNFEAAHNLNTQQLTTEYRRLVDIRQQDWKDNQPPQL